MAIKKESIVQSPHKKNSNKRTTSAVSAYMQIFPILEDLEKKGMLTVDLRNLHVKIDYRLHMEFMFDDQKYVEFFDKIRAWMNFRRGLMQVKTMINPEDRIDFIVYRTDIAYLMDGKEVEVKELFDARPEQQVESVIKPEILLVGYEENRRIDYTAIEEDSDS